jgi:hypothetical protein
VGHLVHPNIGYCKVIAIGYSINTIIIVSLAESKCSFQKIISSDPSTDVYRPYGDEAILGLVWWQALRTGLVIRSLSIPLQSLPIFWSPN